MKLRCGVVSELWEWWYKNILGNISTSKLSKGRFLKRYKDRRSVFGYVHFSQTKNENLWTQPGTEFITLENKYSIFFVIWPMKLGSSACRRDGHLLRDSRQCQLVCYNNDSSLSVLILTLTFASLSYSPLAPSLRKTLVILHLFYVPYSSAYYSNRLTEPRALRCRISYL